MSGVQFPTGGNDDAYPPDEPTDVVMPRCPLCLTEVYAPAVIAFSTREQPCLRCGKYAPELDTVDDYRRLLRQTMADRWERRQVGPKTPAQRAAELKERREGPR